MRNGLPLSRIEFGEERGVDSWPGLHAASVAPARDPERHDAKGAKKPPLGITAASQIGQNGRAGLRQAADGPFAGLKGGAGPGETF